MIMDKFLVDSISNLSKNTDTIHGNRSSNTLGSSTLGMSPLNLDKLSMVKSRAPALVNGVLPEQNRYSGVIADIAFWLLSPGFPLSLNSVF